MRNIFSLFVLNFIGCLPLSPEKEDEESLNDSTDMEIDTSVVDTADPCGEEPYSDEDGDGVCDSVDICEGDDASGDTDGDGLCDDIDPCVEAVFCDTVNYCDGGPVLGGYPMHGNRNYVVNILDYGADWSGGSDSTAAIQSAIDTLIDNQGGVVLIPPGRFVISNTLVIDKNAPVDFVGIGGTRGQRGSRLFWQGPDDRPLLRIIGSSDSTIEGLIFSSSFGYPLQEAIRVETRENRVPCRLSFRDLVMNGTNVLPVCGDGADPCEEEDQVTDAIAGLQKGFRFVAGDDLNCVNGNIPGDYDDCIGSDVGNAYHYFQRIDVANYSVAAWSFEHPSSAGHLFVHNYFMAGEPTNSYDDFFNVSGISTRPSANYSQGGHFEFYGGGGNKNDQDFDLAPATGPITIEGMDIEFSKYAIRADGGASESTIIYRHSRFAGHDSVSSWAQPTQFLFEWGGVLQVEGMLLHRNPLEPIIEASTGSVMLMGMDIAYHEDNCYSGVWELVDDAPDLEILSYGNAVQNTKNSDCMNEVLVKGDPSISPVLEAQGPVLAIADRDSSKDILTLLQENSESGVFHVDDYGAISSDGVDDTASFLAAIADLKNNPREAGVLFLGAGVYSISETLLFSDTGFVHIQGEGANTTTLEWIGSYDPDIAMVELSGLQNAKMEGMTIQVANASQLGTGVISSTKPESLSTSHYFYDIVVDGNAGNIDYGFRVIPGKYLNSDGEEAYRDANGEWHLFQECEARNYAKAGYSIEHSQAKTIMFLNSRFDGGGIGEWGVATGLVKNTNNPGGSFHWIGGGGGNNVYADFYLSGTMDFIAIRDGIFSGSPRFLDQPCGSNGNNWSVNLFHNDWSSSAVMEGRWTYISTLNQCVLPTEGRPCIVAFESRGPLNVLHNRFHSNEPDAAICHYGRSIGNHATAIINNDFDSPGSSDFDPMDMTYFISPTIGIVQQWQFANTFRDLSGNVIYQ